MFFGNGGLQAVLTRLNRARLGLPVAVDPEALAVVAAVVEEIFAPAEKLAVYGTLAPGEVNYHHVADLGGAWRDAAVRGVRGEIDRGEHRGLSGLRLDPAVAPQPVKLLMSAGLPAAWARLDAFEGEEMQRLLVALEADGGVLGVANVYALRRAMIEVLG
jgi:gamma-glutamylcyclotransferase (GGCT)/AIG2-like uncharacterized protein YtfP